MLVFVVFPSNIDLCKSILTQINCNNKYLNKYSVVNLRLTIYLNAISIVHIILSSLMHFLNSFFRFFLPAKSVCDSTSQILCENNLPTKSTFPKTVACLVWCVSLELQWRKIRLFKKILESKFYYSLLKTCLKIMKRKDKFNAVGKRFILNNKPQD